MLLLYRHWRGHEAVSRSSLPHPPRRVQEGHSPLQLRRQQVAPILDALGHAGPAGSKGLGGGTQHVGVCRRQEARRGHPQLPHTLQQLLLNLGDQVLLPAKDSAPAARRSAALSLDCPPPCSRLWACRRKARPRPPLKLVPAVRQQGGPPAVGHRPRLAACVGHPRRVAAHQLLPAGPQAGLEGGGEGGGGSHAWGRDMCEGGEHERGIGARPAAWSCRNQQRAAQRHLPLPASPRHSPTTGTAARRGWAVQGGQRCRAAARCRPESQHPPSRAAPWRPWRREEKGGMQGE